MYERVHNLSVRSMVLKGCLGHYISLALFMSVMQSFLHYRLGYKIWYNVLLNMK